MDQDCDRKDETSLKREKELMKEYRQECKELGIAGQVIKQEVIELAKELPATYEEITESSRELADTCNVYT